MPLLCLSVTGAGLRSWHRPCPPPPLPPPPKSSTSSLCGLKCAGRLAGIACHCGSPTVRVRGGSAHNALQGWPVVTLQVMGCSDEVKAAVAKMREGIQSLKAFQNVQQHRLDAARRDVVEVEKKVLFG